MNGGALQFIDFVMVDNEKSGMDLKLILGTPWGEEKGAAVTDSLIVGHTGLVENNYETNLGLVSEVLIFLTIYRKIFQESDSKDFQF